MRKKESPISFTSPDNLQPIKKAPLQIAKEPIPLIDQEPDVTSSRAATILGCSPSTIARMVTKGELTGYKLRPELSNSPLRITWASVQAVLKRRRGEASENPV